MSEYEGTRYVEVDSEQAGTPEYVSWLEAKLSKMEEALEKIIQWSEAYPLDIFPEPDFKKAQRLLKAGGMTLDAISASNMRHVIEGVGVMAKEALAGGDEEEA